MLIDDCPHSFADLAAVVLPAHMAKLRAALKSPHAAATFSVPGSGPKTIAKAIGQASDFSGCYTLIEGSAPVYVGISRGVLARLRQHFLGKTHFDASLAYAIAKRRSPTPGQRAQAMALPAFQKAFAEAQKYLRTLSVAFVEIANPLELYVFEAYAAMELATHQWNTFRTH